MSNRDGSAFPLSSNCKRTAGFFACLCCLIMLTLPGRSQAQTVTDIYDFVEGVQGYGNYPGAPLIVGPNGVLYGTTDEGGKTPPQIMLRFGKNTLYLRANGEPGQPPFCNQYGFVVENYKQDAAEAKLKALGLDPKPDSKLGWYVTDPNGFRVEICGPGLPEHMAKDCHGFSTGCPGGEKG